jgi:hypothetical protein
MTGRFFEPEFVQDAEMVVRRAVGVAPIIGTTRAAGFGEESRKRGRKGRDDLYAVAGVITAKVNRPVRAIA